MFIDKTKEIFGKIQKISEKYNKQITKVMCVLFVIMAVLAGIGFWTLKETIIIIPMLLIFIFAIFYCLKDIKNRIVLLTFLGCFFTFIISQYVTINTGIPLHRDSFPMNIRIHTAFCVFLSVTSLLVGHVLCEIFKQKKKEQISEKYFLKNDKNKLKLISKIAFYISSIFALLPLVEKISFSNQFGYLGYIANFTTKLPFFIIYIGGCLYVLFFLFMSLNPTKKEMIIPSSLYIIYVCLTLFTGSRSTFVLGIINLVLAIIAREFKVDKIERIINKKKIIIFCAIVPITIVMLNIYNTTRNSIGMTNKNVFQNINDFFANQGSSLAVISLEKEYHEQVKVKRYPYMFYSIVKEVESIFDKEMYMSIKETDNIAEKIYKQNSLGQKISYCFYKEKITEGHGLGSNYVAEAYADGGYIGVVIINILFGVIIYLFNKFLYKNWISSTVVLITTLSFMYVPRDPTFNWLNSITAVNLWGIIIVMYIATRNKIDENNI